jgi:hypothetical protein
MEFLRPVITVLPILFLIGHLWDITRGVGAPPNSDKEHARALRLERERTTQASLSSTIGERGARQLIERWCSAYAQLNAARIVELQSSEVEIVDPPHTS